MLNLIYTLLGFVMFIWYIGYRWIMFYNAEWMYKPINLTTAFTSIVFITITLFSPNNAMNWIFYCIAIFLLGRNIIYTIEDIIDYKTNPYVQTICILMDVLMILYICPFILKYNYVNSI